MIASHRDIADNSRKGSSQQLIEAKRRAGTSFYQPPNNVKESIGAMHRELKHSFPQSLVEQQLLRTQLLNSLAHIKEATQNALHQKDITIEQLRHQHWQLAHGNGQKSSMKDVTVDHLSEVDNLHIHVSSMQVDHCSLIEGKDVILAKLERRKSYVKNLVEQLETGVSVKKDRLGQLEEVKERKATQLKRTNRELEYLDKRLTEESSAHCAKKQQKQTKNYPELDICSKKYLKISNYNSKERQEYDIRNANHLSQVKELTEKYEHQLKLLEAKRRQEKLASLRRNNSSIRCKLTGSTENSVISNSDIHGPMSLRQQLSYLEYDDVIDPDLFTARSANVNQASHLQLKGYRTSSNSQRTPECLHDDHQRTRMKPSKKNPTHAKPVDSGKPEKRPFSRDIVIATVLGLIVGGLVLAKK